ncbi:MAG: hypothetical protein A2Z81_05545 [Omnitrophica WOR_2 bacterium GWA2_45_18]|nr:MAG: hypothetical protein A2Z81_05545 [Omnitrophica WOR_2 bacterium GWA2_45_18]
MISPLFQVQDVIDSPSKIAILRVLASRKGFKATGREIARLSGFSVPATHESLKNLHARNILDLEIIGKQHIYSLNEDDRIVQKIIRPMFVAESGVKEEVRDFLLREIKTSGIQQDIVSLILYGSAQKDSARENSDVDIAVVVHKAVNIEPVKNVFISTVMSKFKAYFGAQLDIYVKSAVEFRSLLKRNSPPVSTLIKSYSVLYGKEPLEV